jgi:DNA-binding transcriptional ArsR family regulator
VPASAEIDRVFQALGDPTRRAIIARLTLGPQSVSRLADPLGVTLTAVAQHLRVLQDTGFVRTEKLGRVRTCSLQASGFRAVEQWAAEHRAIWERRMDTLGDLLTEEED